MSQIKAGDEIANKVAELLKGHEHRRACGVVLNNWLHEDNLVNRQVYVAHGMESTKIPDAETVEAEMGTGSLFAKSPVTLRGTSGVFSYDISDSGLRVCIMWSVRYTQRAHEDHFNIKIMERGATDDELRKSMEEGSKKANEGELRLEDQEKGVGLAGRMTGENGKYMLIVDLWGME
ncbi:hypothetical protein Pelo_12321 [Pelomyxa schiedti]|nr:hypothetical protein Pelo_12321 [Pelomyxa schiedti]